VHQGCVAGANDGEEGSGGVVADVAKLSVGREEYYTCELDTDHQQYLSGHGESPGRWYDAAASSLGLQGEASLAGFRAMFEGRDPMTGELLGRPHGRNAVPAFDVVLRPTKSVSILYGLGDPWSRSLVLIWEILSRKEERSRMTTSPIPATMAVVRLGAPGLDGLTIEVIQTPRAHAGEALVEVHAAALTRGELEWPVDRLPAIPSYELSGVVVDVADDVDRVAVGDAVYALTEFDRDGVAAAYAAVPASLLAPKPSTLDHVESAAIPLPALSAWQGLFDHGRLNEGQRGLVTGAAGGVGQLATQLARWRGAHVIGVASPDGLQAARDLGAHELVDGRGGALEEVDPVDLAFDTVGGDLLRRAGGLVRPGGRIVSVAEEPQAPGIDAVYFVVEPSSEQLVQITRLVEGGVIRPLIDSVFPLSDARAAFERSLARGKRGKIVLRVSGG
jgi:NADPH:quinone reductase-like Zn-dependent oxidoreductase